MNLAQEAGKTVEWRAAPVTFALLASPAAAGYYGITSGDKGSSVLQIFRIVMMGFMLFILLPSNISFRRDLRPLLPLALLCLVSIVMLPLHAYVYENIMFVGRLGYLMLVYASVTFLFGSNIIGSRWVRLIAYGILIQVLTSQLLSITLGHIAENYSYLETGADAGGLARLPSITADELASIAPVFIFRAIIESTLTSFCWLAVVLYLTMITLRRSALLAVVVALCGTSLFAAIFYKKRRSLYVIICVAPLAIPIVMSGSYGQAFLTRMRDLDVRAGGTASGRAEVWPLVLSDASQRQGSDLFLGSGMGAVRDVLESKFGIAIGSHSDWLDMLHGFGIFGLGLFIWWQAEMFRIVFRLSGRHGNTFCLVFPCAMILWFISASSGGFFAPEYGPTYALLSIGALKARYIGGGTMTSSIPSPRSKREEQE